MNEADRCFVSDCDRGAAASVSRPDLPGPLRLCATHTEQFRQSSDDWGITWASGAPAPASVTAPSGDVLWAYRPSNGNGPAQETLSADSAGRGRPGLSARAAGWIEARRAGRRQGPK
ncbi:MAG: hypothetical protein M3083_24130 [Actinomycetota bacterium]|nr:hypothetical protein [Actinomycetota bacterium]